MKKAIRAFTIAELLIVFGIIGVVSVLVNLWFSTNFYEYSLGKEKSNFEAKLTEATKEMNVLQVLSGYSNTDEFVNVFQNHIKLVRTCSSSNLDKCFSQKFLTDNNAEVDVSALSTGERLGQDGNTNSNTGLVFINGATAVLSYSPNCPYMSNFDNTVDSNACISMIYDINGFAKPNKIGKDIALFGDTELNLSNPYAGMIQLNCVNSVGWGLCLYPTMYSDLADITTTQYLGTNNGNTSNNYNNYYAANASGTMMSWALAKKTCEDKGKRLPRINEALTLRSEYSAGKVSGFVAGGVYWTGTEHTVLTQANNVAITTTAGGNGTKTTLRYVRCIAN